VLFAYERNGKTLQRLLTTPTRKSTFLSGTIIGQLAIAIVQMIVLIIFGIFVMHVPWGQSPVGLAVMMVSFGLASVALGTTLGTFIKSERQANNLTILIGMVLSLLGGVGGHWSSFHQPCRPLRRRCLPIGRCRVSAI